MNNFDKEPKEVQEDELIEEIAEDSEDLPDEEIKSNKINENEVKSEEFITDVQEEKAEIIEPTIENLEESIEIETLEEDIAEEQTLEEQMREFHRNLIEASLYAAGRPLTIEELSNKLEFSKREVEELINEVAFDYLDRSTALVIAQIGDRYQMQIKPEYTEKVSKFAKGGAIAERYLRTLTVIALKQPILKSTVIKLRGTGAYEHIKYLIDNGFIDAVKKGRTHELTTTDKYADMFGLPKDKHQLKKAMVTQLGIEEQSIEEQSNNEQIEETKEQENIEQED